MSDFEPKPTTPGRAAPSIAFDRAMTGVDTRCSHLTTLLDMCDLDPVAHVARSAVNLWLTGRSAHRRLVEHDPANNPEVEEARQRLDTASSQLLDVMKRAHKLLAGHATRNALDDMRMELVTAAAQLNSDATTTAGPREPKP
jgi:hypothetical protein